MISECLSGPEFEGVKLIFKNVPLEKGQGRNFAFEGGGDYFAYTLKKYFSIFLTYQAFKTRRRKFCWLIKV